MFYTKQLQNKKCVLSLIDTHVSFMSLLKTTDLIKVTS